MADCTNAKCIQVISLDPEEKAERKRGVAAIMKVRSSYMCDVRLLMSHDSASLPWSAKTGSIIWLVLEKPNSLTVARNVF